MDEEHLNKAKGGGSQNGHQALYNIHITYTGEIFGFINFE